MREALRRIESKEYSEALANLSKDYYVIAVVHIRTDGGKTRQTSLSGHWSLKQDQELRDSIARQPPRRGLAGPPGPPMPVLIGNEQAERAFSASRLLRPGYEAIAPARVESGENTEGAVDLLMFPRALDLESGTGDLDISTGVPLGMGIATIKSRFSLKALAEGYERGL